MGVFTRLFRRSKAAEASVAEEASAAEEQGDAVTLDSEVAVAAEADPGTRTPETASEGAGAGTEAAAEPGTDAEAATAGDTEPAAGGQGADGVEIPKQQSADETAGREAGEGART